MKKLFVIGMLAVVVVPGLYGETFTLSPQTSNAQVSQSGTPLQKTPVRVGLTTSGTYGCAAVFPFALPKIAYSTHVTGASFSANVVDFKTPVTFNGDLYSLGTAGTNAVTSSDFYYGYYNGDSHAVPLQQHFMTPGSAVGRISANSTGNAAIASDIASQLGSGLTQGSYYFLGVSPDLSTQTSVVQGYDLSTTLDATTNWPSLVVTTSPPRKLGRVLFEYWAGLNTDTSLAGLTNTVTNPNYPSHPTAREYPQFLEIPLNLDNNSGDRMRCYFYAPVGGTYTFAIAADDDANLLFSPDGNPADATVVASVSGYTNYQDWGKYPSQQWTTTLNAGQKCYIETQHKKAGGTNDLSVGWLPPAGTPGFSGTSLQLMPATYCEPYDTSAPYTAGAAAAVAIQANVHPRLMLSPAAIARLASQVTTGTPQHDPNAVAMYTALKAQVTTILAQPVIDPSTYVNLDTPARLLQDRVYYLSFYYLMQSKLQPSDPQIQPCATKVWAELQNAATWGGGQWDKYEFLDCAEICHAFAIGYDWCYPGLSPSARSTLVGWIATKGLAVGMSNYNANRVYITGAQGGNWAIVDDTSMVFSALAVLGDETSSPQAPAVLDAFMPTLYASNSMAEFGPDGAWPEGPCYWSFATRYLTTFLSSLETGTGTDYNFDNLPGVCSIGSFPFYYTGPTGYCYPFSDEETGGTTDQFPGQQYLGLKYNQPVYSSMENSTNNFYPTDFIWRDPRLNVTPDTVNAPISSYFRSAGLVFLRSASAAGLNAWTDANALFVGLKAGFNANVAPYNGSGHLDLEIGGFVFDALGVRWAEDMGRDNYSLPNYDSVINPWTNPNRWMYYRARAEGNNTLVLSPSQDGGQSYNGNATLSTFKSNASVQEAVIDMTSAYATTDGNPGHQVSSNTGVTSVKRGMRIVNGTLQIQDELASNTALDLNWFMHTKATISISGDNKTVTLTPSSGNARLQISGPGVTFKSMDAVPLPTSPNPSGMASNSGIRKVWIEMPGTTSTMLTVNLCPYLTNGVIPTPPAQQPLSAW